MSREEAEDSAALRLQPQPTLVRVNTLPGVEMGPNPPQGKNNI